MKILIADDDPQLLRALRITLTAKGYEIVTASNGEEAIGLAADERPDVLLLDLGMPRFNGLEVIHAIRGWSEAPILVVSGRTGAGDKVEVIEVPNADDIINDYRAVVLKDAKNSEGAQTFLDLILSDSGQATLKNFGFGAPIAK